MIANNLLHFTWRNLVPWVNIFHQEMVTNFIIWQLKLMNCARNLKLSLVTSFWRNTEIWRHISVLWISDSLECWRFLDVTNVILKSNFHQNYSFFRQNIMLNSYLGTFLLKYQNFSETSIPLPIPFNYTVQWNLTITD